MDPTTELYDRSGVDPDAIGETIDVTEEELAFEQPYDVPPLDLLEQEVPSRSRGLLARAGFVGAACLATMMIASAARGHRVAEPLAILGRGLPFARRRKAKDVRPFVGLGVLFGGALVLGGVGRGLASLVGARASAVLLPAVAYLVDRNLMGGGIAPRLKKALGPVGMAVKYGTFGIAPLLR